MQQWQLIRLPPVDIQSRHAQIVAFGAATFGAGFVAGLFFARSSRGATARDAAVNTAAEQSAKTLLNGHVSEPDTSSVQSTPRSMVNAETQSEQATPRPASCKLLIIVRTSLLMVRTEHAGSIGAVVWPQPSKCQ